MANGQIVSGGGGAPPPAPGPAASPIDSLITAVSGLTAEVGQLRAQKAGLTPGAQIAVTLIPAVVVAILGALLGAWATNHFGDSLKERSKLEVRREVLKVYFAVDNWQPGKRSQILEFLESMDLNDDKQLQAWTSKQKEIVSKQVANLENESAQIAASISRIDQELERKKQIGRDRTATQSQPSASARRPNASSTQDQPRDTKKPESQPETPIPSTQATNDAPPKPSQTTNGDSSNSKGDNEDLSKMTQLDLMHRRSTLKDRKKDIDRRLLMKYDSSALDTFNVNAHGEKSGEPDLRPSQVQEP